MAQRRMISLNVFNSTRFLRMPLSTQGLYAQLVARADDDGVVEAFSVMRTVGANEDELGVLFSKGFVLALNEDFLSYIVDWQDMNQIRADRLQPSPHRELLVKIIPSLTLPKPRTRADLKTGRPLDNQRTTIGQAMDGYSIDKDSIEEYSILSAQSADKPHTRNSRQKKSMRLPPPSVEEVTVYCKERRNGIDAQHFVDYYTANGWKSGKNPMKDWRAAVRTWEHRDTESAAAPMQEVTNWLE